MYKSLVSNYIKQMSYDDVKNYVLKNYKDIDEKEIKVIYKYLKKRWEELYEEDKKVLEDLKKEVSPKTYQEIMKLLKMAYQFKNR